MALLTDIETMDEFFDKYKGYSNYAGPRYVDPLLIAKGLKLNPSREPTDRELLKEIIELLTPKVSHEEIIKDGI